MLSPWVTRRILYKNCLIVSVGGDQIRSESLIKCSGIGDQVMPESLIKCFRNLRSSAPGISDHFAPEYTDTEKVLYITVSPDNYELINRDENEIKIEIANQTITLVYRVPHPVKNQKLHDALIKG